MKKVDCMKKIIFTLLCLLILSVSLPMHSVALELYDTEQLAQKHCPNDRVVWLNLPSGVYHYKGQRWYANTKKGAFVCEKEAVKENKRPSKRG